MGGIVGIGRHALLKMARQLGMLREGEHSNFLFPLMVIYIEHCCAQAGRVWKVLTNQTNSITANRNEHTINTLRNAFYLPTLCAVQVARYLQLAVNHPKVNP